MHIFSDCTETVESSASIEIILDQATFDLMSTCTKDMYAEYQATDAHKDECGYQDAYCRYKIQVPSYDSDVQECEVRRKGSSTWRDMDDKPSFKIKKFRKPGKTPIQFQSEWAWTSDKVTLNNGEQPGPGAYYRTNGEVKAYDTFRLLGKKAVPRAMYVDVNLVVGDAVFRADQYAMIETINDKYFMKKHFGDHYSLYEVEMDAAEFKRHSDDDIDDAGGDLADHPTIVETLNPPLSQVSDVDIARYYIGELYVGHWDGACTRDLHNNYYIGYDITMQIYMLIPSGLDNTYQPCWFGLLTPDKPTCEVVKDCFQNSTCKGVYDEQLQIADDVIPEAHRLDTCGQELLPSIRTVLVSLLVPSIVIVCLHYMWRAALCLTINVEFV